MSSTYTVKKLEDLDISYRKFSKLERIIINLDLEGALNQEATEKAQYILDRRAFLKKGDVSVSLKEEFRDHFDEIIGLVRDSYIWALPIVLVFAMGGFIVTSIIVPLNYLDECAKEIRKREELNEKKNQEQYLKFQTLAQSLKQASHITTSNTHPYRQALPRLE